MSSKDHKEHLLGENEFYQTQDQIGVGFYYDQSKKHEYYWVVYITALRETNETLVNAGEIKTVSQKAPKNKRERFKRGDTADWRRY